MNLSFFTIIFGRSVQLSSSFGKCSLTLGTLVSTKTKCIKLIFIGKITLVPVAFLMALSISIKHRKYLVTQIGKPLNSDLKGKSTD